MKQYCIVSSPLHSPIIVSTNSHDFCDYMQLGYSIVFSGNRKECERILSDEMELTD